MTIFRRSIEHDGEVTGKLRIVCQVDSRLSIGEDATVNMRAHEESHNSHNLGGARQGGRGKSHNHSHNESPSESKDGELVPVGFADATTSNLLSNKIAPRALAKKVAKGDVAERMDAAFSDAGEFEFKFKFKFKAKSNL